MQTKREIHKAEDFFAEGKTNDRARTGLVEFRLKKGAYKFWSDKLYNWRVWRNISATYKLQNPDCEECGLVYATSTHHKIDIFSKTKTHGYLDLDLFFDQNNFMGVCAKCHAKIGKNTFKPAAETCVACNTPLREGQCPVCPPEHIKKQKKIKESRRGRTIQESIAYAKEAKKDCLDITRMCFEWFIKKSTPFLDLDTYILEEIRDHIENLPLEYGKKFQLFGWQKMALCGTFGSFCELDYPKSMLITMARKQGKSHWVVGAMSAFATFSPIPFAHIDIQSPGLTQSVQVLEFFKKVKALQGGKVVGNTFKSNDGWQISNEKAIYTENGVSVRALASNPLTADGRSPLYSVVDEAPSVDNNYLGKITTSSSAAMKNQQFTYIGTLSEDEGSWFKSTVDGIREDLEKGEDIDHFPLLWYVEKDQFKIDDKWAWKAVCPSWGHTVTLKDYEGYYRDAKRNRLNMPDFLIRRLNTSGISEKPVLCDSKEASFVIDGVDSKEIELKLLANECVIGIDLGHKQNMTAVCLLTMVDGHIYAMFRHFICESSYESRKNARGYTALKEFRENGELFLSGDKNINLEEVLDYVTELTKHYDVIKIYSDKVAGGNLTTDYFTHEIGVDYEEVTVSDKTKRIPCNRIVTSVSDGRLHVNGNRLFRWELLNSGLKELPNVFSPTGEMPDGSYEIVRLLPKSMNGIDGVMALMHGLFHFIKNIPLQNTKIEENTVKKAIKGFDKLYDF